METQRALEPRHMRQLATDLSMGIADEMPKWAAIAWIEHAAALREIVDTVLRANPDGIDFSRLMSRLKVALGLRFSDQAREALESRNYEIVELPQNLCFETLGTHVKRFNYGQNSRHLGNEETHFRVQEVAWDPDAKYMLIRNTRNINFKGVQERFNEFADSISELTEGEAKAVIPNVAMAGFLLGSVSEDAEWDKFDITVWTTDISIVRQRHVVHLIGSWVILDERSEDHRDDNLGLLDVIVPESC